MKRFKNILLVCDDQDVHEDVIDRTIRLATANEADVTLAYVVEAAPGELARMFGALPGSRSHDVEHEILEFHQQRLDKAAAPLRAGNISTVVRVLQGISFVEIIKKVQRDNHDLVIKGVSLDADERRIVPAGGDAHLLRKCPCPVWIIKSGGQRQFARILAAVDPDPHDDQRHALNTLIMDLATSLARIEDSDLHVVNAWRLEEEDTLRNSAFAKVAPSEVDLLVEEKRKRSAQNLKELLRDYPENWPERQVHMMKGAARDVVPHFAAENRVELIVMGTVGRTGIHGFFIGNTAEAILNQVECSVLAVKPPGFETPVR